MEESDRACLRSNTVRMYDNLVVNDKLLAILFQEKILSQQMREEIEAEKTSHSKISKLLSLLPRRGQRAFRCFVEALVDTDQDDLAVTLNQEIAEARQALRDRHVSPGLESRPPGISSPPSKTSPRPQSKSVSSPTLSVGVEIQTPMMNVEIRTIDDVDAKSVLNQPRVYKITGAKRGRALIINNENFRVPELADREGSNYDYVNLDILFTGLQFTTVPHQDKTADEIRYILEQESQHEDHHKADMFVLVIMSHGADGVVCGVDGKEVSINNTIIAAFDGKNCLALRGKPKLFIIQACQGAMSTKGVLETDGAGDNLVAQGIEEMSLHDDTDAVPRICLHERSDIAVAYSTVSGYKSWRHTQYGSWFVRAIVEVFAENACRDRLFDLLQQVRNRVAQRRTLSHCVQITETRETLMKKVYFLPGYTPA